MIQVFDNFFSEELHNKIWNIIRDNLNINSKCLRIYANGQTAGQCGNPHTDDGTTTFLYFVNPEWKINWQGHLMFINKLGPPYKEEDKNWADWIYDYNQDEDEICEMVTYKPNRAVLFPANMLHYADAPHSLYSGLRVSLAYKFYDD